MNNKLVSVIIPSYSRPNNICRAIDSVLNQTYQPIEIIVVDDNGIGTDFQRQTEHVLSKYIRTNKIIYIKHETNKNGSAARNTGFKASNGYYINFLDDDDEFVKTKIEKQVAILEMHPEYDACYCNTEVHGLKRIVHTHYQNNGNLCFELLTGKTSFNTSTILIKRTAVEDINGWDESFLRHQDTEFLVRFYRNHMICGTNNNEFLLKQWATPNIISRNPKRAIDFRIYFLEKMKEDIMKQPSPRLVYRYNYENLCLTLLANGETLLGTKYFFKIMKYGLPSASCIAKWIYYILTNKLK